MYGYVVDLISWNSIVEYGYSEVSILEVDVSVEFGIFWYWYVEISCGGSCIGMLGLLII